MKVEPAKVRQRWSRKKKVPLQRTNAAHTWLGFLKFNNQYLHINRKKFKSELSLVIYF